MHSPKEEYEYNQASQASLDLDVHHLATSTSHLHTSPPKQPATEENYLIDASVLYRLSL